MPTRRNKEKRIKTPNMNVRFGTTDNERPKAVYLECSGFISPRMHKDSYSDDIKGVRHGIGVSTRRFIRECGVFRDKHIVNVEVSVPGIKEGKRSYIFIQAVFAQKSDEPVDFNKLIKDIDGNMRNLAYGYAENMEHFGFDVYRTKD